MCIKKVVFIAFRGLFNQNKILIGMSNDTPDDIKVCYTLVHAYFQLGLQILSFFR